VTELAPGDRVVVPFNISCGSCWMCAQGLQSQCETTQVHAYESGAALFGYTKLYGQVPGGQAEYLRVPFANYGPVKVPDGPADDRFVYLSDVLPTGWQAVEYADVPDGGSVVVLGLGPIGDMCARIAHHRARRPAHWRVVQAGIDLAAVIAEADDGERCILVDCLTLWLVNLICPARGEAFALPPDDCRARFDALASALTHARGPVIVVSNEIGMGVVPLGAMTRRYVDELGRLNQRVAAIARNVTLMVAGLPMAVKGDSTR